MTPQWKCTAAYGVHYKGSRSECGEWDKYSEILCVNVSNVAPMYNIYLY